MMKNLIFFDIDGTIFNEKTYTIPKSTINALKKLKEKGNLAFINTGRTLCEVSSIIKALDFDGYLCGCGTYIELNNKVLFHKSLEKDLSIQIAKDMEKYNLEGLLEGRENIYLDKAENIRHEGVLKIIKQFTNEGVFLGNTWHEENIQFDKVVIFLNKHSDFQGFHEKYKDRFEFTQRTDDFYELVPIGYSKASCIKYICEYLDIPLENTYAIGDSTNDLPMLKYAKTSIAMGNSNPVLFDKVSFVTKDIEDNGIYHALEHYNLI